MPVGVAMKPVRVAIKVAGTRATRMLLGYLVVAFALASVAFVGATVSSEVRDRQVTAETASARANGVPSIEALSQIAMHLDSAQISNEAKTASSAVARTQIADARRGAADALQSYLASPVYPGEGVLQAELVGEMRVFDVAAEQLLATAEKGDAEALRSVSKGAMRSSTDRALVVIHRLTAVNIAGVRATLEKDRFERSKSMNDALLRDVLAFLFTLGCAILAVLAVRRYASATQAYGELLERRATELEQFGETLVHDLRNPLGVIAFCIDRMKKNVKPDPEETVARADRALKRVLLLTDTIFHFARSAGQPEPGARADVGAALRDVVDELKQSAEAEGTIIRVEPFSACHVACEVGTLTSILDNLLRNAVKYTRDRDVRHITVRTFCGNGIVHVEIEDTGPGIPRELVDKVFEPYVRVGRGTQPGLGLGLATVKRFCMARGGRVGVRSKVGEGCIFWFELREVSHALAGSLPLGTPSPAGNGVDPAPARLTSILN